MPTTLENTEAVYGKTEEQYLEEQELLRELAEEECSCCQPAEEIAFDATLDAEDLELPF